MTITLAKEELQAFSANLQEHFRKKAEAVLQALVQNSDRWCDVTRMRDFKDHPVLKFIEQWERENPAPTYKDLL